MGTTTGTGATTTDRQGDVRLMTLDEIEAELARLDDRRRLLMRARKFVEQLDAGAADNGRPPAGG